MSVASGLDDLLIYAQRTPAAVSDESTDWEMPFNLDPGWMDEAYLREMKEFIERVKTRKLLDEDSARAINQGLPLALMVQAALGNTLPTPLRREVALATWVRAGMIGDETSARAVTPAVDALAPELREYTTAYARAATPADREFAIVFALLRLPGLRPYADEGISRQTAIDKIDSYRDNWWCVFDDRELTSSNLEKVYAQETIQDGATAPKREAPLYAPRFLGSAERAALASEWKKLATAGTGPNYLARKVVERSDSVRSDPRLPEALHLAVRATRYGCSDDQTTVWSKRAFQILHARFAKSAWAAKTKYYF